MSDTEQSNPMDTEATDSRTHIPVRSTIFAEELQIPIDEFKYIRTVPQLKQYIDRHAQLLKTVDLHYYSIHVRIDSDTTTALDDSDVIDITEAQAFGVVLKTVTFNIIDRGERYESKTLEITATIQNVRNLLPFEKQQQIEYFTYRGRRIADNTETLYNIGIKSGSLYEDEDNALFQYDNINWSTCLVGMIRLYVKDDLAQLETAVDVYDNQDIYNVTTLYESVARRKLLPGSTMIAQGEVTALQPGRSLFEQHIVDETVLILTTPEYTVHIQESAQPMQGQVGMTAPTPKITAITVYDYYTVRRLKEEYNKINAGLVDALTSNDKLFYGSDEIDDSRKLYTYNIKPTVSVEGATDIPTILLRREEIKMNVAIYICANCGNDVALKRIDAVQCQSCFERILYKRPKPTPRQYICR